MLPRHKCTSSKIFSTSSVNDATVDQGKYNVFHSKKQTPTKIWITCIILCFALCVTIIAIAVCVTTLVKDKSSKSDRLSLQMEYSMNENEYENAITVDEANKIKNKGKINDENSFDSYNDELNKSVDENKMNAQENLSNSVFVKKNDTLSEEESFEESNENESSLNSKFMPENFNIKKIVYKAVGSLTDAAVNSININNWNLLPIKYEKQNENRETKDQTIFTDVPKSNNPIASEKEVVSKGNGYKISSNIGINAPLLPLANNKDSKQNLMQKKNNVNDTIVKNDVVASGKQILNVKSSNKIERNQKRKDDGLDDGTQISSPDDVIGQVTTNLGGLLKEHLSEETKNYKLHPEYDFDLKHLDRNIKKKDNAFSTENDSRKKQHKLNEMPSDKSEKSDGMISGLFNLFHSGVDKHDGAYYDHDYFYSEIDAMNFYYDYERITWGGYILEKIQDLYDWLTNDMEVEGENKISKGNESSAIPQLLRALNYTFIKGDASYLIFKLKDLYYKENSTEFDPERSRKIVTNTSNLISFGLLALDVILLRNIQLIAWDNQYTANDEMTKDPELFAMNAIFMDPSKVKAIYEEIEESKKIDQAYKNREMSRFIGNNPGTNIPPSFAFNEDFTSSFYRNINISEEIVAFLTSTVRAAIHLGRAFRNARDQLLNVNTENTIVSHPKSYKISSGNHMKNQNNVFTTELDCIWTLYCRNLDKATKFEGPYGFLAKLNSVGLRVILGEITIEKSLETLFKEALTDSQKLDCDKFFPKCSGKNASKVVIDEVLKTASFDDERQR